MKGLLIIKNGSNFIVIVLLVLIIAIQAGSLFARATSGNCDAALTAADELIQGGNANTMALMAEFQAASTADMSSEQVIRALFELQFETLQLISQQNSALLNVLGNCP